MKTGVILQGGLGNQLFQWSFGHYLASLGYEIDLLFLEQDYEVEHANIPLGKFVRECEHINYRQVRITECRILRVIFDPSHPKYIFSRFPRILLDTRSMPNGTLDFETLRQRKYLVGGFQNWWQVKENESILRQEIFSSLIKVELSELETRLENRVVIHVRRGDAVQVKYLNTVGVLSRKYYEKLCEGLTSRPIILTDDVAATQKLFFGLEFDEIYGPDDLNTYQALRVMSKAKTLYTANSTLSWWGGFLAISNGANVYTPKPFFRNPDMFSDEALEFPEFSRQKADWQDSLFNEIRF
jgi:hypothetical protein